MALAEFTWALWCAEFLGSMMAEYWRLSEPAWTLKRNTGSLMGTLERK